MRPAIEYDLEKDEPVPGQPAEEVEQALLAVRMVIEATAAKHRDSTARNDQALAVLGDEQAARAEAARLVAQARRRVDLIVAANPARSDELLCELQRLVAHGDSVKLNLLYSPATLDREAMHRLRGLGHQVVARVASLQTTDLLLVDGRTALVYAESTTGCQASVIRSASVIRTLQALFAGAWRNAALVLDEVDFGGPARSELAGRIISRLSSGVTDEVAARELSVSVRTYRRYVAEIMDVLKANSRFQAGARAAELGLLPRQGRKAPARPAAGEHGRIGLPRHPGRGTAAVTTAARMRGTLLPVVLPVPAGPTYVDHGVRVALEASASHAHREGSSAPAS